MQYLSTRIIWSDTKSFNGVFRDFFITPFIGIINRDDSRRVGAVFARTISFAIMLELAMKSQEEIEAAICMGITQYEQEYMGRRPKQISAYLIEDLLLVRLQGVLTVAEQRLVKTLPLEKGRDLLKQV